MTATQWRTTSIPWLTGLMLPASWSETKVKFLAPGMRAGEAITADAIEEVGAFPVYGGNGLRGYTDAHTHSGVHLLIGRQGALCGNVHLVSGEFWASEHAIVATPAPGVDPRWLAHLLGVMDLGQYSMTSAQPGIGTSQVNALAAPLPTTEGQRAIADYLDRETAQIDTLIAEQQRLIDLLRERRVATIAHATDTGALVELRRLIVELRQGWSPNCEPWPADGVQDWGVLKVGCSNSGTFVATENKRLPDSEAGRPDLAVRRGEIVMSRSNTKELVGAVSVVEDDYPRLMLSDLTYGLTVSGSADPTFLAYALGAPPVRAQIAAASKGTSPSMQKISQQDIRALRVRVPSIVMQHQVTSELKVASTKIDTLIAESERFIELARERRSALITAAVTGQIDVSGAAA